MKFARRAAALALLLTLAVTLLAAAAPTRPASRPAAKPATPASRPATPAAPRTPTMATPAPAADPLDAVAAMVNDEAILVSDVEEGVFAFLQQSGARPDSDEVDTLRKQVLEQIIDDRLMQGEAKRQGITVTDAELNRAVDNEIANAKERIGGEQAYQEQLRREGLTEATEAEAYFRDHKDRFPRVPPEVRLQVIQIVPEPDSATIAGGLARINAARKRIVAGEKFAKVAAEVSEDPGSAKAGGDLGFVTPGRMVKAFDDALFALKVNELSAPVRSPFGWHIIQVLERDTVKTVAGRDSLDESGKIIPEVHARHILIRLQPTDADVERAQATATRVREEAAKGTNFGTLVHRYSKYDGPASPEGDVGFISLGSNMAPQLRAGLDTLEIGQVSEVIPNNAGFNIFKLVDRHPEREYTLEEVRDELPKAVSDLQRRDKYETWVKSLRAKAQIEYR